MSCEDPLASVPLFLAPGVSERGGGKGRGRALAGHGPLRPRQGGDINRLGPISRSLSRRAIKSLQRLKWRGDKEALSNNRCGCLLNPYCVLIYNHI